MQVNVKETDPGTAELEILIDQDQYGKAVSEVMDQIARNTQVPGFRKGKAPRSMVERTINREAVRARAIERILPDAYRDALKESGLKPYAEPRVEIASGEDEPGVRFKMIVHKAPEVTPGPIRGLEIVKNTTVISGDDVEASLQSLREAHPEYENDPESSAEKGDRVVVSVKVTPPENPDDDSLVVGDMVDQIIMDDQVITVGEYSETPAIDDDLVGLKVGDVRNIEVTYPMKYEDPALAGETVAWQVTVKEVRKRHVPELTDDWVKTERLAESVDGLRSRIHTDLQTRATQMDELVLRHTVLQKLLESSTIVYPHIMIHEEVEGRKERLGRQLQRSRSSLEAFAASQGVTVDVVMQQMHDQAEEDVREYLLIHRIAADEGIEPTPEEVDAFIEEQGALSGKRPAIVELEKQNESRRNTAAYDVLKKRITDLAIQNASLA